MRLRNILRAIADIKRLWDSPWVTLRRNVTKVQLPHLYLRNLTVAGTELHCPPEVQCLCALRRAKAVRWVPLIFENLAVR